jgi:hypothetical protein
MLREQAMEEPTVSVGPIHHGGDAEAMAFMYFFIQTVFQEVSDTSLLAKWSWSCPNSPDTLTNLNEVADFNDIDV